MSIAQYIVDLIGTERPMRISLFSGYARRANGLQVRFPIGAIQREHRDQHGAVTLSEYIYADGSKLVYTYTPAIDSYTLTTN